MRDGVQLVADHYAPATSQPVGTLLVRGPYGRRFPFSLVFARIYAARGYHVVLQSVRGTFGSGGVFEPMVNEAADGADTVAWLREQPWFTGRFGTIGLPYLGFTQWALLHDPPPELAAAVITVGPHDFRASVWGTGSFTVNDFLGWSDLVSHQEDPGRIRAGIRQLTAPRRVARTAATLPLGESARTLLGTGAPWFDSTSITASLCSLVGFSVRRSSSKRAGLRFSNSCSITGRCSVEIASRTLLTDFSIQPGCSPRRLPLGHLCLGPLLRLSQRTRKRLYQAHPL